MPYLEYPKWVTHPKGKEHGHLVVENADAEAAQFAAWGAPAEPVEPPKAHQEAEVPAEGDNALTQPRKRGRPRKSE